MALVPAAAAAVPAQPDDGASAVLTYGVRYRPPPGRDRFGLRLTRARRANAGAQLAKTTAFVLNGGAVDAVLSGVQTERNASVQALVNAQTTFYD